MLRSTLWRQLRVALMTGLLAGGVGAAVAYFRPSFARGAEFACYDRMALLAQRHLPKPAREPVLMVAIDDASLEDIRLNSGMDWPWPRSLVGDVVEELHTLGAKAVILDTVYNDFSPIKQVDDELKFVDSLRRAGNAVVAAQLVLAGQMNPPPQGRWAAELGSFDSRKQALELAAQLLAQQQRAFLLPDGARESVWFGGFGSRRTLEDVLGGLSGFGAVKLDHAPDIRELSVEEMREAVSASTWVNARDALHVPGAGALHLPDDRDLLLPRPEIAAVARVGFADEDASGSARELNEDSIDDDDQDRPALDAERVSWLLVRNGDTLFPTLPLAGLLAGSPQKLSVTHGRFHYGDRSVPIDRRGYMYITFPTADAFGDAANTGEREHIGFSIILRNAVHRAKHQPTDPRLEAAVKGRYVVIANTAASLHDTKVTPVRDLDTGSAVVAAALRTLVLGDAVARAPHEKDARWAFAMALLGALYALVIFRYARSSAFIALSALGMLASVALYVGYALHLFIDDRIWLAVFTPSAAFVAAAVGTGWINFGETSNDRARVAEALGRFTSPAIVESVLRNPLLIAPKRREISILFSDIAGFTTISESLPAPRLAELLGTYFTEMCAPITQTHGHVDKFIGDAVMAFWNAPMQQDKHAVLACKAALAMRDRLEKLRPQLKSEYGVEVTARIGLNTGEVVVGELGARGREGEAKTNYTCLGDAVNLASRLEGVNKLYDTLILCGPRTVELCGEAFVFRELDRVRVKGKHEAVTVYELLCARGEKLESGKREALGLFTAGLAAYRAREFERAKKIFESALSAQPDDGPSAIFRDRCVAFSQSPPPADWDGANTLDSK